MRPGYTRKKVIYIAGPHYDPRGEYFIHQNIHKAEEEALFVWANGGVALCPQKNTSGMGGAFVENDDIWFEGNLELLSRCDAIYLIKDWHKSNRAKNEYDFAKERGLAVLINRDGVVGFLNDHDYQNQLISGTENALQEPFYR